MIKIDRAILAELEAILTIDQLCFDQRITDIEVKYNILHNENLCLTCYYNGFLCGFVTVKFSKYKSIAFVGRLAVNPSFQNKGIGKALLYYVEQEVKKIGSKKVRLQVRQSNTKAVDFYKKNGYNVLNELPNFYDEGADAYNMEKTIDGNSSFNGFN
jgi:ribosomal protein S18 acetylase RimI-like enzyme